MPTIDDLHVIDDDEERDQGNIPMQPLHQPPLQAPPIAGPGGYNPVQVQPVTYVAPYDPNSPYDPYEAFRPQRFEPYTDYPAQPGAGPSALGPEL